MLRNFAVSILCTMFPVIAAASGIVAANNQIAIQSISTNVDYAETGNGRLGTATGTLNTETGPVSGFGAYLSAMRDVLFGNDYFKVAYDYSSGRTDYVGSFQGGKFGSVVSTSGAIFTNYGIRYGRGFATGSASMLTPYIEYAFHQWERGINYGETYTHERSGLGLLGQYALGDRWVLAADVMYGRTTASNIVVSSGATLVGFSGGLGDSDLYRGGVSVDFAWGPKIHATLGVDYTAFAYGISAVYPSGKTVIWEPDSRTNFTTVRFSLGQEF